MVADSATKPVPEMAMRNDPEHDDRDVTGNADGAGRWILVLVAHDDDALEPQVLKEQLAPDDDEQLCAFLRGGELVAVIEDADETIAEAHRVLVEKECLRIR
jgi:hypothetical protein